MKREKPSSRRSISSRQNGQVLLENRSQVLHRLAFLQLEHYAGNWDVLRPAAEIEEMNTFTADGLNALLHEAEKNNGRMD